jgi:ABC-type uncharacterized transport system auxiliary subunit
MRAPRMTALACATLPLLAACGNVLKSDAPAEQVYVLHPAGAGSNATPVNAVLIVPRPDVQPALASHRIALTQPGNRLDYFADSRWGAALPQVLGALAVESLLASSAFTVVTDDARNVGNADFQLLLTVRHFEAQYAGDAGSAAPVARVAIECLLASVAPRRIVGRCDAEAQEPARANRMGEIVAALDVAAQRALSEVGTRAAALALKR